MGSPSNETRSSMEEEGSRVRSPPTKTIIIPGKIFTLSDHKDLLDLAQQRFNDIRRRSKESTKSVRYDRVRRRTFGTNIEKTKVNQLLSSLLYLSIMMHKVDDMKKVLKCRDFESYNEWQALFTPLHPPVFYLQERQIQNKRVKEIYSRKRQYKGRYENSRADFVKTEKTSQQLSHALNNSIEDNRKTHELLQEKNFVDKDLAVAQKEMAIVRSEMLKKETKISKIEDENTSMHSLIKDLEIQKTLLLQKIEIDTQIAAKKETEEKEMRRDIIATKDAVVKLETEKKYSKAELQDEVVRSKKNSIEFEEKLLKVNELYNNAHTQLEQAHVDIKTFQRKYRDDTSEANEKITSLSRDLEEFQRELETTKDKVTRTEHDLDLKAASLDKALVCQANESSNQISLREIIVSKDNEINRLNEILRNSDVKRAETDKVQGILINEFENSKTMQDEKIQTLERELQIALNNVKLASDKEERISTQAADEKSVLKLALDQSRQDCIAFKQVMQINNTSVEKIEQLLTEERVALHNSIERSQVENGCLTQLIDVIKGSVTHDLQCALENHHKAKDVVQSMEDQLQLMKQTQQRTDKGLNILANSQLEVGKKADNNYRKAEEVMHGIKDQLQLMKETQQKTDEGICVLLSIQSDLGQQDSVRHNNANELVFRTEDQSPLANETQQIPDEATYDTKKEYNKVKFHGPPVPDVTLKNCSQLSTSSNTSGGTTAEDHSVETDDICALGVTYVDNGSLSAHYHQQAEDIVEALLQNTAEGILSL